MENAIMEGNLGNISPPSTCFMEIQLLSIFAHSLVYTAAYLLDPRMFRRNYAQNKISPIDTEITFQ